MANFNGGLDKPPKKLEHGWVINTPIVGHVFTYPYPNLGAGLSNLR